MSDIGVAGTDGTCDVIDAITTEGATRSGDMGKTIGVPVGVGDVTNIFDEASPLGDGDRIVLDNGGDNKGEEGALSSVSSKVFQLATTLSMVIPMGLLESCPGLLTEVESSFEISPVSRKNYSKHNMKSLIISWG